MQWKTLMKLSLLTTLHDYIDNIGLHNIFCYFTNLNFWTPLFLLPSREYLMKLDRMSLPDTFVLIAHHVKYDLLNTGWETALTEKMYTLVKNELNETFYSYYLVQVWNAFQQYISFFRKTLILHDIPIEHTLFLYTIKSILFYYLQVSELKSWKN